MDNARRSNDSTMTMPAHGASRAANRHRLLALIEQQGNLPALGASVAKVVKLSSSENEDIEQLANFILSDIALTQRVLRVANSTYFRGQRGPCTLVSKAILVLGFNQVRSLALTALLLENLSDRKKAARLKSEFTRSFFASTLAREVSLDMEGVDPEAASIGALFKNLGRQVVISLDYPMHEQVLAAARDGEIPENDAAAAVIGMKYDELSELVVKSWGMPEAIVRAVAPLRGEPAEARLAEQRLQAVVSFSNETASCLAGTIGQQRERLLSNVLKRYGDALPLERNTLNTLAGTVGRATINLTAGLGLSPEYLVNGEESAAQQASPDDSAGRDVDATAEATVPPDATGDAAEGALPHRDEAAEAILGEADASSDMPDATLDILLRYVQEIAATMASRAVNAQQVLGLVLEALYRGMGFRRVLGCVRDASHGVYRCRAAMGADRSDMLEAFRFPLKYAPDLFHAALEHGTDVHISDALQGKVSARLPDWYRTLLPDSRSFLLLPLVCDGEAMGFIYADRDDCDFNVYTKQELDLARTLRSQVVLALRTAR
jgi:HD-like signal output (HDOD) protein